MAGADIFITLSQLVDKTRKGMPQNFGRLAFSGKVRRHDSAAYYEEFDTKISFH